MPHSDSTSQFVGSETRPSTAVIQSTAEFLGHDPIELRPLGERIDTDALDSLFAVTGNTPAREDSSGTVRFEYHGVDVRVAFDDDATYSVGLSRQTT